LLGKGTQTDAYTDKVDAWIAKVNVKPAPALLTKAKRVLVRVASKDSELMDLWEEAGEGSEWKASLDVLNSAIDI
jgi:hypothetical protein